MNKNELFEIGIKKRSGQLSKTWNEIADIYTDGLFTGEGLRSWIKREIPKRKDGNSSSTSDIDSKVQNDDTSQLNYKESTEIHRDGSQSSNKLIHLATHQEKDPLYLLQAHGYDPEQWELITSRSSIWSGYSKQDGQFEQYASKISVKPRKDDQIEESEELRVAKLELQKQKYQLQEQRREYNALIKTQAKFEHLKDEVAIAISDLSKTKPLTFKPWNNIASNVKANVLWSDWHVGQEFENSLNSYSIDIFKSRLSSLVSQTIYYCEIHRVDNLTIGCLGDLLAGSIHIANRVQSSEDVIKQIQIVCEAISEAIAKLSSNFRTVNFINIIGNHARLQSNKTESLLNENLEKLIPWYLESRLSDFDNVKIQSDTDGYFVDYDNDGEHVYVHGDLDHVASAAKSLPQVLGFVPKYIFSGHIHHYSLKEHGTTTVISNGSLIGPDDYAVGKRFSAESMQLMHVFNEDKKIEYSIPIYLKD
ncbi:hypothetical protein EBB07_29455 [Paenibacillaceae bacterium]|nr:hypothetical protein EBB07_29455 [Paenibacillaceae bacterium]